MSYDEQLKLANEFVLAEYQKINPDLKNLKIEDENLVFVYQGRSEKKIFKVSLHNLDLKTMNVKIWQLAAWDFMQIIKIHADIIVEKEMIKKLNVEEVNQKFLILEDIAKILPKNQLDLYDINKLDHFISAFVFLNQYQAFLTGEAGTKFIEMQNLIRFNIILNSKLTEAQQYIEKKLSENTTNQSLDNGLSRSLVNPNFPSFSEEKPTENLGYASIITLLFVILNVIFILTVFIIKK